jgi:hypothetical protein
MQKPLHFHDGGSSFFGRPAAGPAEKPSRSEATNMGSDIARDVVEA